ncbi:MAG TPA: FHA domain-containing protein [Polyangiaceae bacterium]|nr:FHA domain-containing protein [Polyangiaceae bacterium]
MFAIIVHEKGGAERREVFDAAELSVGRVQGNELMLPKGNVSKRHARLLYRDGRFIVTDLNSTNGTYVNRRKITQATIVREGDRIYIGDFVLRIEASNAELSPDELKTGPSAVARSSPSAPEVSHASARPESDATSFTLTPGAAFRTTSGSNPISSPVSSDSPAQLESPVETTGTHSVGRTTQDDRGEASPNSVLAVVRSLVDRVALRLRDVDLLAAVPPSLGERIEGLLQEAWTEVSEGRDLPAGVAADRVIELARCELVEHGPLTELIADPTVSEVGVTRFDRVLSVRAGRSVTETGFSSDLALRWAIARLCAEADVPLLPGEDVIERRIMPGVRLSAVLGSIAASGACVAIRKTKRSSSTLEELVRRGAISRAMATFLQQCLAARVNLLVVGPRDGGVEALLSALAQAAVDGPCVFLGERDPGGSEANLLLTGANTQTTVGALQVAAAMPGARIVAELFSGDLCARVVEAIADGGDGLIAARYAPSLRRGLSRLPGVVAAERPQISVSAARELVANAFEIVVEVARLRDDRHRVLRIAEVIGCTGDDIQTQDVFTFVMDRTAAGGAIEGVFSASGVVPQVAEAWRARGTTVESAIFSRPPSR